MPALTSFSLRLGGSSLDRLRWEDLLDRLAAVCQHAAFAENVASPARSIARATVFRPIVATGFTGFHARPGLDREPGTS